MELFSFFSQALVILVLSIVFIIWKTTNLKKAKYTQTCSNQPPQPPKLPIIGNIHQIICPLPYRRFAELSKIYGPIMQLQLGQVSAVVVSSPELAKQVLKDNDIKIGDRCRISVTNLLFYNRQDIAFAPYGEYWRQMRKICILELLSMKRVQSFGFIREEEISDFITSIDSKVGSPINLSRRIFSLSSSIAARTVIGRKNRNQEAMLKVTGQLVKSLAGFTVLDMFPSLEFIHIITGMKSKLLKLHKEADRLLEQIIKEHQQALKSGDVEAENNLLSVLLKLQADPDSPLTTDGIKALTLEMFLGLIDTSTVVIEWAMSELMKNSRVMKKAQEEVRKVCVENGKLDESIIKDLKFLKAIIKETMRLHPPGPLIPRECREKCEINGYDINPKTEVLVNVWAIGRDPNYWNEPEKFNPERFIDNEIDYKGCNFEFVPFGAGRRICPGLQLGVANIELHLAKILYHFDWELPNQMNPEDLDMIEAFGGIVRRKNHLYLTPFTPRSIPV